MENIEPQNQPAVSAVITEDQLFQYREKLKLEQNLLMGIVGGTAAALIGALLWAVVTVITKYQIGYMAIGVGLLVGFSVRYFGKGIQQIFGVLGAVFALVGCLFGNFLSMVGFAANAEDIGYLDLLLQIDYTLVPEIMMEGFSPMDILFYGLALYEGYKFSFRQITEEEVANG